MTVRQQLAVQNDCYRRNQGEMGKNPGERDSRYARYYQGPQGVMIHSTGAENPNLRRYVQPDDGTLGVNPNGNDWNRPGLDVAVHAFIGLTRSERWRPIRSSRGSTGPGTVAAVETTPIFPLRFVRTICRIGGILTGSTRWLWS